MLIFEQSFNFSIFLMHSEGQIDAHSSRAEPAWPLRLTTLAFDPRASCWLGAVSSIIHHFETFIPAAPSLGLCLSRITIIAVPNLGIERLFKVMVCWRLAPLHLRLLLILHLQLTAPKCHPLVVCRRLRRDRPFLCCQLCIESSSRLIERSSHA